ncbi:MAG TPA: aminotransferase class V-fold PLP-dependent enzyme [Bacteroidota bacterium]|nr:aminotransferase class V-fold PLP-dependent enzyme [Bacteroidota bacterium]
MPRLTVESLRGGIVGLDTPIPLLGGGRRRYVFLDNAASTPTFRFVLDAISAFMPWYSGVHRGTGYKAVVATRAFDETRKVVGSFVGSDPTENVVIYGNNTTGLINMLAARFDFRPDDVVIATMMEHHSNDLPWRKHCRVVHVGIDGRGGVDLAALRGALAQYSGRVRLIAVSGASNVTGFINPIHEIAEICHAAGASILVDAAQLVAHRKVDVLDNDDPRHIDFLVFSGHKIYAPFGIGALVGPRSFFAQGEPVHVGGGAVSFVSIDEVEWSDPPNRDEAGSPNVVGAVALAASLRILSAVGLENVEDHERELLAYCTDRARSVPGIRLYGPADEPGAKVGVLPFTLDGFDHSLVATILSAEGGIGVRNGNFCAQVFTRTLLDVTPEEEKSQRAARCDNPLLPGMVRASLGCYNSREDVDLFIDMLHRIVKRDFRGKYSIDPESGAYRAEGYSVDVPALFTAGGFIAAPEAK